MAYRYDMRDKTPQQQAIGRAREHSKDILISEGNPQKPMEKTSVIQRLLIVNVDLCPELNITSIVDQCIECVHYKGVTVEAGNNCILCDHV